MSKATDISNNVSGSGFSSQNKKFERPNFKEQYAVIQEKRENVTESLKKIREFSEKIQQCREIQTRYITQRDETRRLMDDVISQMNNLDVERTEILLKIDERQKEVREEKSKVQILKRSLEFQSEKEIDTKIASLEKYILNNKLSVHQENQIISKIQQLRQKKSLVSHSSTFQSDVKSVDQSSNDELRQRLELIKEEVKELQKRKRLLRDKLTALYEEHQKNVMPLNDLFDLRAEMRQKLTQYRQEEATLLQEVEVKNKEYQLHALERKKEAQEKKQEEARKRHLEQTRDMLQKELEKIEDQVSDPQYILAQQLFSYVKTQSEKAQEILKNQNLQGETVPPSHVISPSSSCFEGLRVIKPKSQREEEVTVVSKKKNKKLKKGLTLKQPLIHDITILADFERLNIPPPLCLEDCFQCLESIVEKLAFLKNEKLVREKKLKEKEEELLQKLEKIDKLSKTCAEPSVMNEKTTKSDSSENHSQESQSLKT
ncbi:putative leucine-rich repeat-containing protein DDB_G0290503 [Hylaeus volcanicus]|uniref:putative leucine-rich repeat-containing protein DDB_G0290503 n=1 Tax=Hylaeus volcanicus TaxID=313075 RepID=UPI0023B7B910|nr:putative leucine-rich repeat-containing protein DDB_G0290503 [Hylaeus volcanicus]